jgi:hypothetical protein
MNVGPAEQVFEEVPPYLETLDAQIGGIVQLLKDKGITTTESLRDTWKRQIRGVTLERWGFE